jgi:hypothetical protein
MYLRDYLNARFAKGAQSTLLVKYSHVLDSDLCVSLAHFALKIDLNSYIILQKLVRNNHPLVYGRHTIYFNRKQINAGFTIYHKLL